MIFWIDLGVILLLVACLLLVCIFEFVNGSNDTANAVSPIIYSHSLKPKRAVLLAAIMNFLWVTLGWVGVAMSIVHLLPLDIISERWSTFWICVVVSLLLTAIVWNSWTRYLAIPSSSSHTLIGSIFWVGIAMSFLPIVSENTVSLNWSKITEVIESLLLSPIIWFWLAFVVMTLAYKFLKKKDDILDTPKKKESPELWLKTILIWASSWVSYAHGSNDGQKWVGLATLILICLLPSYFAVNPKVDVVSLKPDIVYIQNALGSEINAIPLWTAKDNVSRIQTHMNNLISAIDNPSSPRADIRTAILLIQRDIKDINWNVAWISQEQSSAIIATVNSTEFQTHLSALYNAIDFAPWWIILMISISIGLWTMLGRKRVANTLWKKIGNHKLNYAESTSSALITALTITVASRLSLPVSTTHVFSSSIAGCMMTGKKPWVQKETIKHILMAWVLTLPSTIVLSWTVFSIVWFIFLR